MKQIGYLAQDQYGNSWHLEKHPRKELLEKLGYKKAQKMYADTKEGKTKHTGYVIGQHWINVYRVCEWKEGK